MGGRPPKWPPTKRRKIEYNPLKSILHSSPTTKVQRPGPYNSLYLGDKWSLSLKIRGHYQGGSHKKNIHIVRIHTVIYINKYTKSSMTIF